MRSRVEYIRDRWTNASRSEKFFIVWTGLTMFLALSVATSPEPEAADPNASGAVAVFFMAWAVFLFLGGLAYLFVALLRGIFRFAGRGPETGARQVRSDSRSEIAALRREIDQLRREREAPRAPAPALRQVLRYPRAAEDAARQRADRDPRWQDGEGGDGATFIYVDSDGEVTERTIRNWHSAGAYIHGYCLARRQSRTFRKDRIEDWSA